MNLPPRREDEFTKPHAECANPGLWTATDAQSTEIEVTGLVAAFVRALQPELVVETGSFFGNTAVAIGEALAANGHGRAVSLEVDPDRAAIAAERCQGLPVEIRAESSASFVPDGPVGFAWLDSLLDLRVPEFLRLRPFLTEGAVVGFHDTGMHLGNLGSAVRSLGLPSLFLRTPRGVAFVQV